MGNKRVEILVGFFVLIGVLAFALLSFRISGLAFHSGEGTYRLYAYFDDASGVNVRARVTIAGVIVGRVENIILDRTSEDARVALLIDRNINFLTTDTSIRIQTSGLLGEKYLALNNGADETYLRDGDVIENTQSTMVLENLIGKFLTN